MSAEIDIRANLDSLVDTMANVVGILIVVMAVAQITVGQAVRRIHDQELALAETAKEVDPERLDELREQWAEEGPRSWEMSREIQRLRDRAARPVLPVSPASSLTADERRKLNAALAALMLDLRAVESEIDQKSQRLAALQLQADEIEDADASGLATVRLPDPRPAPAGSTRTTFVCRFGRIAVLEERELQALLFREMAVASGLPHPQSASQTVFARLIQHFASNRIGDSNFHWTLSDRGRMGRFARVEWNSPDLGESWHEVRRGSSEYREELRRRSPRRDYLHFFVWGDSFNVYLEARKLAEDLDFPVGWTAYGLNKDLEGSLIAGRRLDDPLPID